VGTTSPNSYEMATVYVSHSAGSPVSVSVEAFERVDEEASSLPQKITGPKPT